VLGFPFCVSTQKVFRQKGKQRRVFLGGRCRATSGSELDEQAAQEAEEKTSFEVDGV
jgi:hypothetical protein